MSDHHALTGAYAVDALDTAERESFERHLERCDECRAEVLEMRETAALLAETTEATPPPGLRARVVAQAAATRPLPPVVVSLAERTRRGRLRTAGTALVAAAAVVAVFAAGAVVMDQVRDDDAPVAVSDPTERTVAQVLAAGDAERWTQEANGGGTVTVVRSPSLGQAVLQTRGLAAVPSDKTRELWLLHGNEYLPAGYLPAGSDHTLLLDGDPTSARGFGISVEDAQGAASPSEDLVALMPFTDA